MKRTSIHIVRVLPPRSATWIPGLLFPGDWLTCLNDIVTVIFLYHIRDSALWFGKASDNEMTVICGQERPPTMKFLFATALFVDYLTHLKLDHPS